MGKWALFRLQKKDYFVSGDGYRVRISLMDLLSLAAKESSKERPLLALRSASQKKALRCYPSALFSCMALFFARWGANITLLYFVPALGSAIELQQACLQAKRRPSWALNTPKRPDTENASANRSGGVLASSGGLP